MKTKIEIKSIFGNVIFTYEAENATIKDAVEQAIKEKVNLRSANLISANLISANLSSADLISANLSSANLSSADLSSAKNIEEAYLPVYCKWNHSVTGNKIKIGCQTKTIKEWDEFFASDQVYSTKRNTDDFKQIEAVYKACKAYLTFLNK